MGKKLQGFQKKTKEILAKKFQKFKMGSYTFFNKTKIRLGKDYDWITNPLTGFKYDIHKHWSEDSRFIY